MLVLQTAIVSCRGWDLCLTQPAFGINSVNPGIHDCRNPHSIVTKNLCCSSCAHHVLVETRRIRLSSRLTHAIAIITIGCFPGSENSKKCSLRRHRFCPWLIATKKKHQPVNHRDSYSSFFFNLLLTIPSQPHR